MPAGFRGRRPWLTLVVAVPALHVAVVVPQVSSKPVVEISWVQPVILTIVFFIATNALGRCWLKRCDRIKPDAT